MGTPTLRLAPLFLLALSHCGSCHKDDAVSYVDAPTTLKVVRAKHKPPDVVVKVERFSKPQGGGGSCGHSPACIIIVPFLLVGSLFPDQYDVATIEDHGKVTYTGTFATNGDFLQAQVRESGTVRDIRRLDLLKLGKHPIVEVGRGTAAADGGTDGYSRTPILPQVDLLADYRAKLAKEERPQERGDLVSEAWKWLGPESMALVRERLESAAEADATKAAIVTTVCQDEASPERTEAMKIAALKSGPQAAAAGASCLLERTPAEARPFYEFLIAGVCDSPDAAPYAGALREAVPFASREQAIKLMTPRIEACKNPTRRTVVRGAFWIELTDEELGAAVHSKDSAVPLAVSYLNADIPKQRVMLVDLLRTHAVPYEQPVVALHISHAPPSPEEAEVVTKSYLVDEPPTPADGGAPMNTNPRRRARTLDLLAQFETAAIARANATLHAALDRAKGPEHTRIAAALVVLDEADHELQAARGLALDPAFLPLSVDRVTTDEDLVYYAMRTLKQCNRDQLKEAAGRARKAKPEELGVVCVVATGSDAATPEGGGPAASPPHPRRHHPHHH